MRSGVAFKVVLMISSYQDPCSSPDPGSKPRRWLGSLVLLSGLVGGGLWLATSQSVVATDPEDPGSDELVTVLPVEVLSVEVVSSYRIQRSYTGEVVARRVSELGFEQGGTLVALSVDQGDQVEAGAVLGILDTQRLETQRQQLLAQKELLLAQLAELEAGPREQTIAAAQASVQTLQEQLELADVQRSRRQMLYEEGAISREQFDVVETDVEALSAQWQEAQSRLDELLAGTRPEQISAQRARVRQVDASLAQLEVDRAKSQLVAPFAGRIAARHVDEGTVVAGGQPIVRLVEDRRLEAHIGIPTETVKDLPIGSQHTLQLGEQTWAATVTALLPEVNPTTRTITAILEFSGSSTTTPGQTIQLALEDQVESEGVWLPTTALSPSVKGLWSVYALSTTVTGSGFEAERHDVEVLHTDGERVFVRGTLQPGDQVIRNGSQRIVPGQRVQPIS